MLIFSDVDGTLLDDDGGSSLSSTRLQQAARQHQVVLASSRAVSELHRLQVHFGFSPWCIAEDGAVIAHLAVPQETLGVPRAQLLSAIRSVLSSTDHDALVHAEPLAARRREASVLLPMSVITPKLRECLEGAQLRVAVGGRWATITGGADKGSAARVLGNRLGVTRWAAIGNAPNDATLLGEAWRSFVVRNPEGHDPVLARIEGATLLTAPGPDGWLEMLELLEQPPGAAPEKESHDDDSPVDHHHPDDSGP